MKGKGLPDPASVVDKLPRPCPLCSNPDVAAWVEEVVEVAGEAGRPVSPIALSRALTDAGYNVSRSTVRTHFERHRTA
jgi:hypothetical protein